MIAALLFVVLVASASAAPDNSNRESFYNLCTDAAFVGMRPCCYAAANGTLGLDTSYWIMDDRSTIQENKLICQNSDYPNTR